MENQLFIDLIRGLHLLFIVLGMGTALYCDLRSLRRLSQPISETDIIELCDMRHLISYAFIGLWLSGAVLIWIRTGFDIAAFSPKLWCKIIVVTILAANSVVLHNMVFPAVTAGLGTRLGDFPAKRLFPMALSGGISLAGWMLALALGSSQVLKVADWDTLMVVMLGSAALFILSTVVIIFTARTLAHRARRIENRRLPDPRQSRRRAEEIR